MNYHEKNRKIRRDQIIEIGVEAQDVLRAIEPHDSQIIDLVEECTGYRLSGVEMRLALTAYNSDEETAKRSVWYNW